ncbi:MAG: DNA-binding protein [Bacteroidota bacterium]|nr:DNA-binding protein [Bacteroidota bacterium]
MTMTFNELRKIKNSLPHGAISRIAEKLNMNEETVRNYFGGTNYREGESAGINVGPGPDGGIVSFNDTTILDMAREIVEKE